VDGRSVAQRRVVGRGGRPGVGELHPGQPAVVIGRGLRGGWRAAGLLVVLRVGHVGQRQVLERVGVAEQQREDSLEGGHLARVGDQGGQRAGPEFGYRAGVHDRHGAGQPLAPVRADREPGGVQRGTQACREGRYIR
jgi:hypothetical protein